MFTIMIVEDDMKIMKLLQSHIDKYGYHAVTITDFDRVLERFRETQPDMVLLDINLPKYDGFYWCRQIRTLSTCPILFISARDSKMDQVMALENGADDYITKPFDYELVMAKIRSHLRRAYGEYAMRQGERTVEVSGLVLYPERLTLTLNDQSVELTQKESTLLEVLMSRPKRVVSRDRLLEKLWDDQHFIDDNTLNVYVTRVRKKLKELGIGNAIETVRGAGYMLKVIWKQS
ncbi:response regulator transcription factor [Thermoflavimicrobium daqui]|jgi:OmpR family two-component system response regulator YxdJ|uniref:DNA-binding response regulator n=1 Tax=Thermoflavimicrobium daqui TaxID=2137476 RepID=A0A364K161_9BACL|nr:response regulator transcription factor [Thermoflavimicrobium daqui]RAL21313.1 DNA-binding response regulator [Thermoflavimicrobium daqui]